MTALLQHKVAPSDRVEQQRVDLFAEAIKLKGRR